MTLRAVRCCGGSDSPSRKVDVAKKALVVKQKRTPKFQVRGYTRTWNFGVRFCLTTSAFFATSTFLEGESEPPQQRTALSVIGCGGYDGDVHPALPVHLVRIDLVEHDLLDEAERVVAVPVELPVGQAAEVADPGQRDGQQPVQELPHAVPAQRDVRADGHALAQLELGHGLLGLGHGRLLPGDGGQVRAAAAV